MAPILSNTTGIITRSGPQGPSGPPGPTLAPNYQIQLQNAQPNAITIVDLNFYSNNIINTDAGIVLRSNNFPTQPNQLPLKSFIFSGGDVIGVNNTISNNLPQNLTIPGQTTYAILRVYIDGAIEQFNPIPGANMSIITKLVNGVEVDSPAVTVTFDPDPVFIDPVPLPPGGSYDFFVQYVPL